MKYIYNLNYKVNNIIHFEQYIKQIFISFEYSNYYNDIDKIDLFFTDNINEEELTTLVDNYINPQINNSLIKFMGGNYITSDLPFFKTVNTFEYGSSKTQKIENIYIHSYCIPYNKTLNNNDYYQIRLVNITQNKIINTVNLKNIDYKEDIINTHNFICFENYHWEIQVKCLQPCIVHIKNVSLQIS